jgi:hypothetical protein
MTHERQINREQGWIKGPFVDLFFFSFGWVLALAAFFIVDQTELKAQSRNIILISILLFSFLHRHLTFPLVYGDPEQFRLRKKAYIFFPVFFLALTLFAIFYTPAGAGRGFYAARPLLLFLVVVSVLWNIYHTIMQKVGILRIYSRKSACGKSWVDKALLFAWLIFVFLQLGNDAEVRRQAAGLSHAGKMFGKFLELFLSALPFLSALALIVALWITFLYLREEYRHREQFHWPKNLFVLSVLSLYAAFWYDLLAGYAVFGFSHAIEYLAFVYIYAGKKFMQRPVESSWMARAARRQGLAMGLYCLVFMTAFLLWRLNSVLTLGLYILGSSFLHFLYDGWIWKVRDPKVGSPLGIHYGSSDAAADRGGLTSPLGQPTPVSSVS